MAYFEGITPTDIELYDSSGLGNKIPIWFRDLGLVFGVVPSPDVYATSDAVLKALDDRVALMGAAEKAYQNFKISYPWCKCDFGGFRRACRYKSERLAKTEKLTVIPDARQQVHVLRPEEGQEQDRGDKEVEIRGREPIEAA